MLRSPGLHPRVKISTRATSDGVSLGISIGSLRLLGGRSRVLSIIHGFAGGIVSSFMILTGLFTSCAVKKLPRHLLAFSEIGTWYGD